MIEMKFTPTGRIYAHDGNIYALTVYANDTYRLVINNNKSYSGLDVKKFDIKKHLIK